jgi:hypothetical protein
VFTELALRRESSTIASTAAAPTEALSRLKAVQAGDVRLGRTPEEFSRDDRD